MRQKVVVIEASEQAQTARLRVAAYCRVSSSSEDQLKSFAAQNRYYNALISGKENWELVDIYADSGITGTSSEKRTEFQRLLSDCRRGLIDRVLCKSISRFARNTTDCLVATRELKSLGGGVCFEEENIDTSKLSGEMLTAVFAALAQAGSKSISDNQRMGIQMRMKNGTFIPVTQFGKKATIQILFHGKSGKIMAKGSNTMLLIRIRPLFHRTSIRGCRSSWTSVKKSISDKEIGRSFRLQE